MTEQVIHRTLVERNSVNDWAVISYHELSGIAGNLPVAEQPTLNYPILTVNHGNVVLRALCSENKVVYEIEPISRFNCHVDIRDASAADAAVHMAKYEANMHNAVNALFDANYVPKAIMQHYKAIVSAASAVQETKGLYDSPAAMTNHFTISKTCGSSDMTVSDPNSSKDLYVMGTDRLVPISQLLYTKAALYLQRVVINQEQAKLNGDQPSPVLDREASAVGHSLHIYKHQHYMGALFNHRKVLTTYAKDEYMANAARYYNQAMINNQQF